MSNYKEKKRQYYLKNKERILKKSKQNYLENKEHKLQYARQYRLDNQNKIKEWRFKNKEILSNYRKQQYLDNKAKENRQSIEYITNRRRIDVDFKLRDLLRTRLNRAIKGHYKSGSAVKDLGCTVSELKDYLESRFQEGMSWDNHGEWHIDHIKPLSKFDLTDREDLTKACHYTNLQPLWAKDNLKKSNK